MIMGLMNTGPFSFMTSALQAQACRALIVSKGVYVVAWPAIVIKCFVYQLIRGIILVVVGHQHIGFRDVGIGLCCRNMLAKCVFINKVLFCKNGGQVIHVTEWV
jgi:hypothetical protein